MDTLIVLVSIIVGAAVSLISIFIKEKLSRKTQIKIEKIKLYDKRKRLAYIKLYEFTSHCFYNYIPDSDCKTSFIQIMRHYYKEVKSNYFYFDKNIREELQKFEGQHHSIGNPDLISGVSLETFYRDNLLDIVIQINNDIEKKFDDWNKI